VDSGGGVSGKRYTVTGGWGGTDRLGALYEWRVIRPQLHETMFADQLQSLLRSSNQGS